jgi:putative oxidoreductase
MVKEILFGGAQISCVPANAGLALLRIFTGIALAFAHGIGKVPPSEQLVGGVEKLGFPIPTLFAWAAGLSEFAGGILLALGLFTRLSGFFIAFTMFVAAFGVHLNDPFLTKEKALMYMFTGLCFMAAGSGNWGVDAFIRERDAGDE